VVTNTVSAVLFVKDLRKVASFYREVLGASLLSSDPDHEVLNCLGFHLVVHQIPMELAQWVEITTPPVRRERTAVRLDFPVVDIEESRRRAQRLGGQIDDLPPPWATGDHGFFLGYDPEGNVVGVMPANKSLERTRAK
jgi:predicted enzyme related to lactoylglutathione lyase